MLAMTSTQTPAPTPVFFMRDGSTVTAPVWFDEKGRPMCTIIGACTRCAGQGGWKGWPGFTCYRCGGHNSARHERTECRLYTTEQLVKLNQTKAKRDTTKAAKAAEAQKVAEAAAEADRLANMTEVEALYGDLLRAARPYMDRNSFIADVVTKAERYRQLSSGQVEALNNAVNRELQRDHAPSTPKATFIGEVGQRLVFVVRIEKVLSFDTQFGLSWLHITLTPKGETVIYRGSNKLAEEGETIAIKATIKEHKLYRGINQTVVSRPKLEA